PLSITPVIDADSVEDDSTGATHAALRVREQIGRLRLLAAIELIVAAQAVDLALDGRLASLGAGTGPAHAAVREWVAPLAEDRPMGPDVERLTAELVAGGQLLQRVAQAGTRMLDEARSPGLGTTLPYR